MKNLPYLIRLKKPCKKCGYRVLIRKNGKYSCYCGTIQKTEDGKPIKGN
jgi:uncharacterized Zn finger protein (UPF0148 family)